MSDAPNVRARLRFDPTINLGHVLTAGVFLATTVAGWVSMQSAINANAREITRVENAAIKIETNLLERIKSGETAVGKFELNYREDVRDLKQVLTRIEDKLDRKADKPAR